MVEKHAKGEISESFYKNDKEYSQFLASARAISKQGTIDRKVCALLIFFIGVITFDIRQTIILVSLYVDNLETNWDPDSNIFIFNL